MSTNNKISTLVNSQVPFFVRNDHPTFVSFLEAYYEYLEQSNTVISQGKTTERAKNFLNYIDVDKTLDEFSEKLYNRFLTVPLNTVADKDLILKHVKDFYRSKGTEKSYRFLMRALYGEEIEFYYPKTDVLKASDGKWYIQKSLRVTDTKIAGAANSNITGLEQFSGRRVTGNSSGAFATVERVDRFLEQGTQIDELILSGIKGEFENGEKISTTFVDSYDEQTKLITSNVFGGIISSVGITNPGSRYKVGDHVIVISADSGAGACVVVGRVSTGNLSSINVIEGGAGFQNGNFLLITGGGGAGANAEVQFVNLDGIVHPTSYNVVISTISLEANTPINNTKYSNLVSSVTDPANAWIANSMVSFVYGNTGPVSIVKINARGTDYASDPTLSIIANTRISEIGAIGRINILNGGSGYTDSDYIQFTNVLGGLGFGANANVTVNGTGSIVRTSFLPVQGQFLGGSGYDQNFLPTATVISDTGSNAQLVVKAILGQGAEMVSANSTIGAIERIDILNRGSNYTLTPTLSLTANGDGLGTAFANVIAGVFTYPGRYLNDDGHLSAYNFLQDRDYYQNFSYVIRIKQSIDTYRNAVREFLHPAGMKLFGEYISESSYHDYGANTIQAGTALEVIYKSGTYNSVNGNVTIRLASHHQSINSNVYIEFTSGDVSENTSNVAQISNGEFRVVNVINANAFGIVHYSSQANTSGSSYVGVVVT